MAMKALETLGRPGDSSTTWSIALDSTSILMKRYDGMLGIRGIIEPEELSCSESPPNVTEPMFGTTQLTRQALNYT